jgi:maleylacetoacetate isomerase
MSQFPFITRICEELQKLEAFQKAEPSNQPDCPEELKA